MRIDYGKVSYYEGDVIETKNKNGQTEYIPNGIGTFQKSEETGLFNIQVSYRIINYVPLEKVFYDSIIAYYKSIGYKVYNNNGLIKYI